MRLVAGHLEEAFGDLDELARIAVRELGPFRLEYDTIIGTGLSGALVVPTIAKALNKYYGIVRKGLSPTTHSWNPIEGNVGAKWIFMDDFISSGRTFDNCKEAVREMEVKFAGFTSQLVGHYQYRYGRAEFYPIPTPKPEPMPTARKLAMNSSYGTEQCDCDACKAWVSRESNGYTFVYGTVSKP